MIPRSLPELERAVCLLGNRTKAELKQKSQQELTELVGFYPTIEQATAWKQMLNRIAKDMRADQM